MRDRADGSKRRGRAVRDFGPQLRKLFYRAREDGCLPTLRAGAGVARVERFTPDRRDGNIL